MSAEDLYARLKAGANRLARCWEVVRTDGVRFGFTDHDVDLSFDGLAFEARTGLDAGAIDASTGLSVDNAEVVGALSSLAISEADVLAGRFDNAVVRQWLVDWTDVEARVQVFAGTLGEIRTGSGRFEAELRGLSEALNHPVGRAYLKTCDRELGDAKCGVDLSSPLYSASAQVLALEGAQVLRWSPTDTFAAGWFAGGALTWESGANAGLCALVREDVVREDGRYLTLWAEPRAAVVEGDGFRVVAGCDKHIETCRVKFSNVLNFRGFPYLPGDDWVTAYPRSGVPTTGSQYWAEDRNV